MNTWSRTLIRAALVSTALAIGISEASAEDPRFDVTEAMIPMRDGVRLHTRIFRPKDHPESLPMIFRRTPYGVEKAEGMFENYFKSLVAEGYLFVFQDIRGKFGSEGTFVMQRPPRMAGDPERLDEGTDTYDTIDWLLKNGPNNNGRVGMLGVSYDGWTTIMGAIEPHPALKAISPQASPADMWLGDDFHHNGAFRLSYGFEYATMMEGGKEVAQFSFDRYDTFDWYLNLGPLSNVDARHLHGKIPTWNDFVQHPDYDQFWKAQTMIPHLREVKVPTLNVAGWWDQEDFFGPIRIYDELEKSDKKGMNYLVVGPWNHGGWSRGSGEKLGPIGFDQPTARYFRDEIQAPWFAYFLKDKGKLDLPEALTFESGSNRWRKWDAWPPVKEIQKRPLYFGPDQTLSFDPPSIGEDAADVYQSDPAHPVPYRHRPIQATYFGGGSKWPAWLVEDQRFVEGRGDVLTWESPVLDVDLTIAGDVVAHLFASTTGSDADWIVKLIDVYPEQNPKNWDLAGYQLMVSSEVFRGRYRRGFEKPEPIASGEVLDYTFSLHTQNYTFLKGHRLMVQVQSSWFPLIDRNPQTFVPNIFEAKAAHFQAATHKIFRSRIYASNVELPVVVKAAAVAQADQPKVGFKDTPMLPGDKWHVHDGDRPQPKIVTPGRAGQPPSDAVVLFDGTDLSKWQVDGKEPGWKLEDGAMVVPPSGTPGGGTIMSKEEFGDSQIHVEFASPDPPKGSDQGRGNSGVLIMGRYEIQVLDSFENITYADGQASAIYGQFPPQVNASKKPGEWQTYDIFFTAPRFTKEGTVEKPAYVTVVHNGVLTQNHVALLGPMVYRNLAKYSPHGPKGPIAFQDHGNPVRYRNIWVREIKDPE